jgi:heat shock 70kDa protein 1/2/6/8
VACTDFPLYCVPSTNIPDEDNTSLGEFTLGECPFLLNPWRAELANLSSAPIPPVRLLLPIALFVISNISQMKAGDAALEVVFEVDVNGILKVTATEKSSGRSANITISNAVGKLSTAEIEKMVEDAEKFKTSDDAFTKKFEAKQQLESYIGRVEELINDPGLSMKMKRGNKAKIEEALSDAMQQLEVDDSSPDDLKKKELALKRAMTKAMATR